MTQAFPTVLALLASLITAPLPDDYDLPALLQQRKLTSFNRVASAQVSAGKRGIRLDERAGEGIVWLNDVAFSSGTIEIDVRGQDVLQRSFIGIAFHAADDSTYDAVYFRPFNFLAKDSVRAIHAVQYISHPDWTWKRLRDERNAQYEKAVRNPPDPNGWFHARIEVTSTDVRVFVEGDATPALTVKKISTRDSGKLGLWVGDGSGGEFANLRITRAVR